MFSNGRPDLALHNQIGHFNVITDVRTALPSLAPNCPVAAAMPGHTIACADAVNDAKWIRQAAAQGPPFYALVS